MDLCIIIIVYEIRHNSIYKHIFLYFIPFSISACHQPLHIHLLSNYIPDCNAHVSPLLQAHALILAVLAVSFLNPIHLLFTPLMRHAVAIRDDLKPEDLHPVRNTYADKDVNGL